MDVLVDREGKATALIIGVGGFLGMGEKDVAVPFGAVQVTSKDNNKWYLVMNSSKDALKSAKGFKYDRNAMTWMPEWRRDNNRWAIEFTSPADRPTGSRGKIRTLRGQGQYRQSMTEIPCGTYNRQIDQRAPERAIAAPRISIMPCRR
jgi:hypothetical protein